MFLEYIQSKRKLKKIEKIIYSEEKRPCKLFYDRILIDLSEALKLLPTKDATYQYTILIFIKNPEIEISGNVLIENISLDADIHTLAKHLIINGTFLQFESADYYDFEQPAKILKEVVKLRNFFRKYQNLQMDYNKERKEISIPLINSHAGLIIRPKSDDTNLGGAFNFEKCQLYYTNLHEQ